jgi:hypothetical protein
LQRVQPRAADEVHQIDGIVAHAARDHQEGLGGTGTRELVGWVEKCLGDFFVFFLKLKSGSWMSKLARSSEKLVLLFQLWPQNDLSPSSCIQEAKPRPGWTSKIWQPKYAQTSTSLSWLMDSLVEAWTMEVATVALGQFVPCPTHRSTGDQNWFLVLNRAGFWDTHTKF